MSDAVIGRIWGGTPGTPYRSSKGVVPVVAGGRVLRVRSTSGSTYMPIAKLLNIVI